GRRGPVPRPGGPPVPAPRRVGAADPRPAAGGPHALRDRRPDRRQPGRPAGPADPAAAAAPGQRRHHRLALTAAPPTPRSRRALRDPPMPREPPGVTPTPRVRIIRPERVAHDPALIAARLRPAEVRGTIVPPCLGDWEDSGGTTQFGRGEVAHAAAGAA